LFSRQLCILFIVEQLHELSRWVVSSISWINDMYGMFRGFVLRHDGSNCDNRRLCPWIVLGRLVFSVFQLLNGQICIVDVINQLLKLSQWLVSSINRIDVVHGMSCRVVLRNHGSFSRERRMRCWVVLGRIGKCVFKLLIRHIYSVGIFDKLLKLSHWIVSSVNRILCVYGLSCGFILRHHGLVCRDGIVCCW